MNELNEIDLSKVVGGFYDPAVCGAVTSTGGLVGGAVGTLVGKLGHVPNLGWAAGAATGAALAHRASPACHGPEIY